MIRTALILICIATFMAACSTSRVEPEPRDPYEKTNRSIHAFNKGFDKNLVGPAAKGYGAITPPALDTAISNFASFLGLPGQAVNNILQFDLKGFGQTLATFVVNALTFGIADPASEAGIVDNDADFGQTLYVWGVPSGPYLEVPLLGPATVRYTVGFVVDLALNPTDSLLPEGTDGVGFTFKILDRLGDRNQFADIVEGALYDTTDSYLTSKTLYLQNRKFHLNKGVNEDTLEDPFADF